MNSLIKSVVVALCVIGYSSLASAAAVLSVSFDPNAESAFLGTLSGTTVTENFDGLGGSRVVANGNQQASWENRANSFNTNVGSFTLTQAGQSGAGNVHNNQLMIESRQTGEFGRESLSSYAGDFWLDSNDAKQVVWTLNSASLAGGFFNALGFYLADAADVGAKLTLNFSDGTSETLFTITPKLPNANVAYVSLVSDKNIVGAIFTFTNSTLNDGWGIDDVTIGRVPEPGTLLLLLLGLAGLFFARKRKA